ncbi:MAG: glycosyltransferase family 2 protein [Anaerolineales bacterium]|nr:glycosyltransferase family 2 protein [Anaerolineales bacterium]
MRVGQNPAKAIDQVAQPQKVTLAVVNYIPFLSGYYAEGLDILKLSLDSIWRNTDQPYDLLVFDNASCVEVRQFLQEMHEQGSIQYLMLSDKNIGKSGAWNFIFGAAPGEYVAYVDNDVYFYPGWLSALLKVLETFPQAGMVTGMPLLNPEEFSTSTVEWVERHPGAKLERGHLLSWDDFWQHAGSLGNDEAAARAFYEQHESIRLSYQGQEYFVGAGHFQFVAPCKVLQQALPFPSQRPMGQVRALDVAINRLGYLRLCTPQWWVRHLGNSISGSQWAMEAGQVAASIAPWLPTVPHRSFWDWKPIRKLLNLIHDRTFGILYRQKN